MNIATWNVNGIRAREAQVVDWLARDKPDVVCLQEIKARPDQVPEALASHPEYWCFWHCAGPYSGVGLHFRRERWPERPEYSHPSFDRETRIVQATLGDLVVASVYVPNGGKDYAAKLEFLSAVAPYVEQVRASGRQLVLCGDMNVTRSDLDLHPKERKVGAIGQRPDERELFEKVLAAGLVDVARTLAPDDGSIFTWWAPWRSLRQRNIGWRIDYVLASNPLAATASACPALREFGTSDHAPVVATFADP